MIGHKKKSPGGDFFFVFESVREAHIHDLRGD